MRSRQFVRVLIVGVAFCLGGRCVSAAEIFAADAVGSPGATTVVPVMLTLDADGVSGLQFDLEWDSAFDVSFLSGGSAQTVGKKSYSAVLGANKARCVVFGPNQLDIPSGAVMRLVIVVFAGTTAGSSIFRFSNIVAVNGAGDFVPVAGRTIRIDVQTSSSATRVVQPSAILNAASLVAGPVAPGEVVTLLGPGTDVLPASTGAENIMVRVNGIVSPALYIGEHQINAIVPFGTAPGLPATIVIETQNGSIATATAEVKAVQPGIFTPDSSGAGPAIILNQDFSVNSAKNAALRGEVVMAFGTGFGQTDPPSSDGQVMTEAIRLKAPVTATIGDREAEVLYAGSAPGLIAGVAQINVRVPPDLVPGDMTPLVLRVDGVKTQNGIFVAVR